MCLMQPHDIIRLRVRLGWSLADLARALDVDTKTVWRWEAGLHTPTPKYEAQLVRLKETLRGDDTQDDRQDPEEAPLPVPEPGVDG